jgi:hypothetical protein
MIVAGRDGSAEGNVLERTQTLAAADGRTLSNYLRILLVRAIEAAE